MKKTVIITLCFLFTLSLYGQQTEPFFSKSKLTYGGGIGFGLNTDYLSLLLAPSIGYRLIKPLTLTLTLKYEYDRNIATNNYINSIGVGVSTKIDVLRLSRVDSKLPTKLFAYGAYNYDYYLPNNYTSYGASTASAGLGLRQYIGPRSSIYVLAYWILWNSSVSNWDWEHVDAIPTISTGFEF